MTSVRFTRKALDQIDEEDEWWRTHRLAAPELFLDELESTIERLVEQPRSGTLVRAESTEFLRVLTRKTRRHVYYVYDEDNDELVIHAVWGAVQGSKPDL